MDIGIAFLGYSGNHLTVGPSRIRQTPPVFWTKSVIFINLDLFLSTSNTSSRSRLISHLSSVALAFLFTKEVILLFFDLSQGLALSKHDPAASVDCMPRPRNELPYLKQLSHLSLAIQALTLTNTRRFFSIAATS